MTSIPPPPPGPPPQASTQPRNVTQQVSPTLASVLKGLLGNTTNSHRTECRDPELHQAAYRGDLKKLKEILEKNEGRQFLNFRNHLGCTPLRLAVAGGRVPCVNELLRRGANINIPDIKAQSPVMVAAKNHNVDILHILLEAGANPNGDQYSLYTPLFWAAQEGNCQIVKELLKYGALTDSNSDRILNAGPYMAQSPARIAMAYGHLDCFRELLLAGAEQTESPVDVQYSMYHAAIMKDRSAEFITLLYDHGVAFPDQAAVRTTVAVDIRLQRTESWQVANLLFSEPRSLMAACRITIRKHLCLRGRLSKVQELPLPTRILQFLQYV